jgi:hypothetical protein
MSDATTTVLSAAHVIAVISDDEEYRAECCCGWTGEWQFSPDDADQDGTDHRGDISGSGGDLDTLMGALLDLQDDIAEAVLWFAENWSADLPAPCVLGDNHQDGIEPAGAGLTLAVACGTRELLHRIAHRLGVPVLLDVRDGDDHCATQSARRRFGQVLVHAHAGVSS